ncbi:hypothetical protein [Microbacterium testaceum]|uniref:hypothetical protein n=1 Tax=Microbacterium testaceum TaxID=2033 RepID=UPI0038276015
MTSPTTAWTALRTAMIDTAPLCAGDDRFVADDSDPAPLIAVCQSCPLLTPCRGLAMSGNIVPVFGIVGGMVRRGTRSRGLVSPRVQDRRLFA